MRSPVRKFYLLVFVLCISNASIAQGRITKEVTKEIERTCQEFLDEYTKVISDFDAPTEKLLEITSDPLGDFLMMRRAFYQEMEYETWRMPPTELIELVLEDSIGCIVDIDNPYKINLKKRDKRWIVTGYENHEIDQEDIEHFKVTIEEAREQQVVKDSIKLILNEFVIGLSELREKEESGLLQAITTKNFYDFLYVDRQYDALEDRTRSPVTMGKMERVYIYEDTARCYIEMNGLGRSTAMLLFREGVWKIAGMDGRICTQEEVTKGEERVAKYIKLSKFNDRIGAFNEQIDAFFKTGDRSLLKEVASSDFIDQLEIYRRLMGTFNPKLMKVRGLGESSWPDHEFVIYGDVAFYKHFDDSVRFVKQNNMWLLDEVFAGKNIGTQFDAINKSFRDFMDLMHVSYSIYNVQDDSEAPPATPVVMVEFPDRPEDTLYYNRLDDYYPEIIYSAGHEQLYKDLNTITQKRSNKIDFKGVIYVEFLVDEKGKVSTIKALDKIGSKEAEVAISIVEELQGWKPDYRRRPIVTNMVVAVQF